LLDQYGRPLESPLRLGTEGGNRRQNAAQKHGARKRGDAPAVTAFDSRSPEATL